MSEKIVGYLLLIMGIGIILYSGISAYSVFSGKLQPVQLFNFEGISINMGSFISQALPAEAQNYVNQNSPQIKQEILPAGILNDTTNILAHYLLMGFIASIGFKIASLGTMMVRPIVVKMKTQEGTQ